jgi:hypothetical protein
VKIEWTGAEIEHAIRTGVAQNSHKLFPPTLFASYGEIAADDTAALIAVSSLVAGGGWTPVICWIGAVARCCCDTALSRVSPFSDYPILVAVCGSSWCEFDPVDGAQRRRSAPFGNAAGLPCLEIDLAGDLADDQRHQLLPDDRHDLARMAAVVTA